MKNRNRLFKVALAAFITCLTLPLAGCWDKVELENRGFVVTIGIDKYQKDNQEKADKEKVDKENVDKEKPDKEKSDKTNTGKEKPETKPEKTKPQTFEGSDEDNNKYTVSMAIPNMAELTKSGGGGEKKQVRVSTADAVTTAMHLTDSYSSKKLYFGHTKAVILGEELIKDEKLFKEAIDALERNQDISRKLIVLCTKDKAEDTLNTESATEPLLGVFISSYYRNNEQTVAVTFLQDMEKTIRQLRASGNVMIPRIEVEGSEVKLSGCAVVKDFRLVKWLNEKQTRGFLWAKGKADGAQVTVDFNGIRPPLSVESCKSSITFSEESGALACNINVSAAGSVSEFIFKEKLSDKGKLNTLCKLYENAINEEMLDIIGIFRNELKVDGLELKELLRKKDYKLYEKYKGDWDEVYSKMNIAVSTYVQIKNTGYIK